MNNPLALVDPMGLDCIYAADAADNPDSGGEGTVTILSGDCANTGGGSDSGVYVDGTIDLSSPITYDPNTGDLTFGLTNDTGGYGTGIAFGVLDPALSPNNSLMPALGQAYTLGIGPMNVMSVAFVAEVGGIAVVEAAPVAVAAAPKVVAAGAQASAAATVAGEVYIGWQNIYQFTSGFVSNNNPPLTEAAYLGNMAGKAVRWLMGQGPR